MLVIEQGKKLLIEKYLAIKLCSAIRKNVMKACTYKARVKIIGANSQYPHSDKLETIHRRQHDKWCAFGRIFKWGGRDVLY